MRERERQSASRLGAETEGDTESKAGSRLPAVNTELNMGLKPTNLEIMTHELKLDAELTEPPTCSPHHAFFSWFTPIIIFPCRKHFYSVCSFSTSLSVKSIVNIFVMEFYCLCVVFIHDSLPHKVYYSFFLFLGRI